MTGLQHPLYGTTVPRAPAGRTAHRLTWRHLPPVLRSAVEDRLGAAVLEASSQDSGFTPGFASRLLLADGRRVFLKAANLSAQPMFAAAYAEEARVTRLLPLQRLPVPRPLWTERDLHGWTVLAIEDVEGWPPGRPWAGQEVRACLDALTLVARATDAVDGDLALRPMTDDLPTLVTGWERVLAAGDRWPHHDELDELARAFPDLVAGDPHFVHLDARDDNFLLLPHGRAVLCDWNWPALGPVWVDVVHLLVSVHGDGLDADVLLRDHPVTVGVPSDAVDSFVAALCGYMAEADLRPVPASSPHLGTHRQWWAAAAYSWLAARRGWR